MSTLPWRARKKPLLNITAGNKDMHLQTSDLSFELGSVFCCFQEPELVIFKTPQKILQKNNNSKKQAFQPACLPPKINISCLF
jgi:hypothetical protein